MAKATPGLDTGKFINPAQIGGIESYVIDDGAGRGVRALCVNTGGGMRYRVLADRGLDIDQAFFGQHSLTFLTHKGVIAPTRGLDRGTGWLKSFPGGLLKTCGPFNIGEPCTDAGEELGQHGTHSTTAATIESIVQPDPRAGRTEMRIVGRVRYGAFYEPMLELRRTITSTLGSNAIDFVDELTNPGNKEVPHAWLLHINFGYPLLDAGSEICCDARRIEPMPGHPASEAFVRSGVAWKKLPNPKAAHSMGESVVLFTYPKPDRAGRATVGIVNRKLSLGVAIQYDTRAFTRCINWQHFARGEYVTALEPSNGTVRGRDKDRASGDLDFITAGGSKTYRYRIEVLSARDQIEGLLRLNRD